MLMTRVGQWLNLVERCFRVAEAESSNLSCPTNLKDPGDVATSSGSSAWVNQEAADPALGRAGKADSDKT